MGNFDQSIRVDNIISGKFRRYHHLTVWQQLTWTSLVLSNLRDMFLVIIGFWQSLIKLIIWRPDVVFTKGGYVCLPVGIAARILGIPLIIHDSDAHPGLTNRILSRWATAIATGAPLKFYSYPKNKSKYVGIPIATEFHRFTATEKTAAREKWGIDQNRPLIVITGGGLGAQRVNDTVILTLSELMKLGVVVLNSGVGQYDELRSLTPPDSQEFQLHPFISHDMALLLGAADVVIARAGATTILELAALAKPTILIPNAKLTGGHQLKNAAVYEQAGAVRVINEDEMVKNPDILVKAVSDILSKKDESNRMSEAFAKFTKPDAAHDMAEMIISSLK